MEYFLKKKHNFTKKKKNLDRTSQGPSVEVFPRRRLSKNLREFSGRITGLRCYDKNRLSGGVRFCFAFFPFFCLPELFSFISLPFFTFLKSSLSTKPTMNNHRSLTTTYMHKFIDYKTSHTVKISLDYEYYTQ